MWFGGEKAEELENHSEETIKEACMKILRGCQGNEYGF